MAETEKPATPSAPPAAAKVPADPGQEKAPAAAAPPAPPAPAKPTFQIYNRQKDQHVVGPGCWCFPKVEVVNGKRIVVHKRS